MRLMEMLFRFEHPPPWGELHWRFGRPIDLLPAWPLGLLGPLGAPIQLHWTAARWQ